MLISFFASLLIGALTAAIATPVFRWHYRNIHRKSLNRQSSWTYAGVVIGVTTVISYLTFLLV